MSDPLVSVAETLIPFLAGGATAVAAGTSEGPGVDLCRAVSFLVGKLRDRIRGTDTSEVRAVLEAALAEGVITEADLLRVWSSTPGSRTTIRVDEVKVENSPSDTTNIDTFKA